MTMSTWPTLRTYLTCSQKRKSGISDLGCLPTGHSHVLSLRRLSLMHLPARSDHSIVRRYANREVYEYMTLFLIEKWGKGGRRRGW